MGNEYSKEQAIAAQNAGTSAATLTAAALAAGLVNDTAELKDLYHELRLDIFNGTFTLAYAEVVLGQMEGKVVEEERQQSAGESTFNTAPRSTTENRPVFRPQAPAGGNKADPASLVIKFGKHAGSTVQQAFDADPEWVEWCANKDKDDFMRRITREFLADAA